MTAVQNMVKNYKDSFSKMDGGSDLSLWHWNQEQANVALLQVGVCCFTAGWYCRFIYSISLFIKAQTEGILTHYHTVLTFDALEEKAF